MLMLAYSILPKPETKTTSDDAYTLFLNDLAQQGIARDEIQVFNFTRSGDAWTADVIVTRAPHSKCPTSEKRSYSDVLSFKYRPEQLIKDCAARSPIVLREEAIIDSGVIPQTAGADYACAFSAGELAYYDKDEALAYCPLVSSAELLSFAQGVPAGSWVIQWNKNEATIFVALDAYGNVLKTS
ncbi:MAG: hypothetical protein V1817_00575 [Candidatus Micrarchaeota archaeon]